MKEVENIRRIVKPDKDAIEHACRVLASIYGEVYYTSCVEIGTSLRENYEDDYVFVEKFSTEVPQKLGIGDPLAKDILHTEYLKRKKTNDMLRKVFLKGLKIGVVSLLPSIAPSALWIEAVKEGVKEIFDIIDIIG